MKAEMRHLPGFGPGPGADAESRALLFLPGPVVDRDLVVRSPMEQEVSMGWEGF